MVIQWQICQNSYPIKKNIEWSCSFNLQPSLLLKFVQNVIMLGLKKIRVVTNFLKSKKIIKFFKYCRGSLRSWAKAFSVVGWRVGSDPLSQQDLAKALVCAQDKHPKRKTTNNNKCILVNAHIYPYTCTCAHSRARAHTHTHTYIGICIMAKRLVRENSQHI